MRIDLHTHSSISDGTDTPTALVRKAHEQGLDVLGLCDHDTFDGLADAIAEGNRLGVRVIAGIEMSTKVQGRSIHLLGYGCDPSDKELSDELLLVRAGRSDRVAAYAERLTSLGLPLDESDILDQAAGSPSVGRPHVADAMVAKGYVSHRDEAFALWLGEDRPGYVGRYECPLERAIDLVHGAGGAAVIAHPWGRGSKDVLTEDFLTMLVQRHGLDGVEVDHTDHDESDRAALTLIADRLGLVRTGSSDHHGLGKTNNPLGVCTTQTDQLHELERRVGLHGGRI